MISKMFVLAFSLTLSLSSFAGWVKILDCKDAHKNQLVIDMDSENNSELQLVVRPSADPATNAIRYFFYKGLTYSTAVPASELLIDGTTHSRSIFIASDEYISHEVRDGKNGVTLYVTRGSETGHWNFPYCR